MFEEMKEYSCNGKLKIYLAGPWFNPEQDERIVAIERMLEADFDVFSPRRASLVSANSTKQDLVDTFNGNVTHIDDADFVLAIIDGNDVGTIFECGYAYAKKKPILYFNETRKKEANLMLAMSGGLPYITGVEDMPSREKLAQALASILSKGISVVVEETSNSFDFIQ